MIWSAGSLQPKAANLCLQPRAIYTKRVDPYGLASIGQRRSGSARLNWGPTIDRRSGTSFLEAELICHGADS